MDESDAFVVVVREKEYLEECELLWCEQPVEGELRLPQVLNGGATLAVGICRKHARRLERMPARPMKLMVAE